MYMSKLSNLHGFEFNQYSFLCQRKSFWEGFQFWMWLPKLSSCGKIWFGSNLLLPNRKITMMNKKTSERQYSSPRNEAVTPLSWCGNMVILWLLSVKMGITSFLRRPEKIWAVHTKQGQKRSNGFGKWNSSNTTTQAKSLSRVSGNFLEISWEKSEEKLFSQGNDNYKCKLFARRSHDHHWFNPL